jgi:tRNA nucleotidyltransferase (CCA-adding enzyme)
MVYLLAIMGRSRAKELDAFCSRFLIPKKISEQLILQKVHADKAANLLARRRAFSNSEIYWLLQELDTEGLLYLMAIARKNSIKKAVSNFVTDLQQTKTELSGRDLLTMGYSAGPGFKIMLNDLLDARLDGQVKNRKDEVAYIKEHYPL